MDQECYNTALELIAITVYHRDIKVKNVVDLTNYINKKVVNILKNSKEYVDYDIDYKDRVFTYSMQILKDFRFKHKNYLHLLDIHNVELYDKLINDLGGDLADIWIELFETLQNLEII
jgi:hypothetical protein